MKPMKIMICLWHCELESPVNFLLISHFKIPAPLKLMSHTVNLKEIDVCAARVHIQFWAAPLQVRYSSVL